MANDAAGASGKNEKPSYFAHRGAPRRGAGAPGGGGAPVGAPRSPARARLPFLPPRPAPPRPLGAGPLPRVRPSGRGAGLPPPSPPPPRGGPPRTVPARIPITPL